MNHVEKLMAYARSNGCSDIHLTEGELPVYRKNGSIWGGDASVQLPIAKETILALLTHLPDKKMVPGVDLDFSYVSLDGTRKRVNMYQQQKRLCAAIRLLNDTIPTFNQLGLPPVLEQLAREPKGLVLVTGPTGSGKSTTLAAMVDYINSMRKCHIITIEDPIEYKYSNKSAIIHQREVGEDIHSFAGAIKGAMRQDPDVILVGEMRDLETISAAITAAETGHLVLSTLHTTGAANTINRIIDVFPPHGQGQIRTQLASTLKGVVSQSLVPRIDTDGRCAALEVLVATDAISSMIRENKIHQMASFLQTGTKDGMRSMSKSLAELVRQGKISLEVALEAAADKEEVCRLLL